MSAEERYPGVCSNPEPCAEHPHVLAESTLSPDVRLFVRDDRHMIFVDPEGIEHVVETGTLPYEAALRGLLAWWQGHVVHRAPQ